MIGAGSVVFSRNLTGDILGYPEFADAAFSYMDVDTDRLSVGASLCRKMANAMGANPKIDATTDRRKALEGADFVINMVQIGGFDSTLVDFEIPRKYGLNFTIADTTGPGGLFRALRTFPMLRGLCQDMTEVCPAATLLNYSNPMSMNMQTITRTSNMKAVGLCHSVQGTFEQLMRYIGEDPEKIAFQCAGINHMAFYLRLEKDGGRISTPACSKQWTSPRSIRHQQSAFRTDAPAGIFRHRIFRAQCGIQPLFHSAWEKRDRKIRRADSMNISAAATRSWTNFRK